MNQNMEKIIQKQFVPKLNFAENAYFFEAFESCGKKYLKAQSFHLPEHLAAVEDESGAYHIHSDGREAYSLRYLETFGFYEGIATVRDTTGYRHISTEGNTLHDRRFHWSGNFQEGACAVQDRSGYYHIEKNGTPLYCERYSYVGDFRYGVAVVRKGTEAWHIGINGEKLYPFTFAHAEVFHKGFAVVRDVRGAFHVNKEGRELYPHRFSELEPFYNGHALARTMDGQWARVRPTGHYYLLAPPEPWISVDELSFRIKDQEKVALILRHSEREKIPSGSWGMETPLTEKGRSLAQRLGEKMPFQRPWNFISSPVERCKDTCCSFARGQGNNLDPSVMQTSSILGEPGAFSDPQSPPNLKPHEFMDVATAYVLEGFAPGFRPLSQGCLDILRLAAQSVQNGPALLCTHDFFIAGLFSFLSLHRPVREDWVDYLEGVCLFFDGDTLTEWRRFQGLPEVSPC